MLISEPVNRAGIAYSVVELVDTENFLATKNLTLSDTLQKAWYNSEEGLRKFGWILVRLAYYKENSTVGIGPCLYGFMIDSALKEAP